MSDTSEKQNEPTLAELAEQYLKDGKAKTKNEAMLLARKKKAEDKAKTIESVLKQLQKDKVKAEKAASRKKETREKIVFGGLVLKAGLGKFDHETLYGGFLKLLDFFKNEENAKDAKKVGAKALAPATPAAPAAAEPPKPGSPEPEKLRIVFPGGKPSEEVLEQVRTRGFRWNKENFSWEGSGNPSVLVAWVESIGGRLEAVK